MVNVRTQSFGNALSLHEAMNRLFEESFVRTPWFAERGQGGIVPALDVSETADGYTVEASVPGLKAEDLNITFENGVLTITGEVKREQSTKERNYHYSERSYGKFQRAINLPTPVKVDAIQAVLKDGVLRLEIPKVEEVKPQRITVHVGEKQLTA